MPYKDLEQKKAYDRAYVQKHKIRISHSNRIRYAKKRKEILARSKAYYKNNADKCREAERQRRLNNLLEYNERNRARYLRRREKHAEERKRWTKANIEKVKAWQRQYQRDNRGKIRMYILAYRKNRCASDADFKLRMRLTSRIAAVLKGTKKSQPTMELIGCDLETLKTHLQSRFTDDMTWNNYGFRGWHIDHIVPCALFDLTDPEQQHRCFHYTNLQPLWWRDNLSKGNKLL